MVGLEGEAAESSEMSDWRFARPLLDCCAPAGSVLAGFEAVSDAAAPTLDRRGVPLPPRRWVVLSLVGDWRGVAGARF